jgi:hypothetical protein
MAKFKHLAEKKPGSFEPGLFQDAVHCSCGQVLLRVGHGDKSRLRRVFEVVMAAVYSDLMPTIGFQHPDQLG